MGNDVSVEVRRSPLAEKPALATTPQATRKIAKHSAATKQQSNQQTNTPNEQQQA
jgi:hypothetical protein